MNICWSCLGLGKSFITLNLTQVQGLNSTVACNPGSWEGWILRGNWHLGFLGEFWGKGGDVEGERSEG